MDCEFYLIDGMINNMKDYNRRHHNIYLEYKKLSKYYVTKEKRLKLLNQVNERYADVDFYLTRYEKNFCSKAEQEKTILLQNMAILTEDINFCNKKIKNIEQYRQFYETYEDNLLRIKEYTEYLESLLKK